MKFKYLIIIILFFSILVFFVCIHPKKINDNQKIRETKEISIKIKENTLSSDGATILITDENRLAEYYGIEFKIEKKESENWQELQTLTEDIAWTTKRYLLDEKNQLEMKQNWKYIYGSLDKGKYRLIKYVNTKEDQFSISVEFEIK